MNKLWQIYAWITISLAFIFMGVIGFWLLYPYKPLEIKNQPMKVLTPQVKVGDTMFFEIDYCKYLDLHSQITRTLIDTVVYNMPTFTANNKLGCHKLTATAEIPNIPAGNYIYRIKFDYEVNPIRHVLVVAETEKFEIVGEDVVLPKPVIYQPIIKNTIIVPTTTPAPQPAPTPKVKGKP